jgi:four helix bundle protein
MSAAGRRTCMTRRPEDLIVFRAADELVFEVYRVSTDYPADERFGLRSQLRRAAVSVPTNLVEGCARRSRSEYVRFVEIASSSAAEARHLVRLSTRLGFLPQDEGEALHGRYDQLVRGLHGLLAAHQATAGGKRPA